METGQPRASAGKAPSPNPEAIAWYVEDAQRLLEDQQRRVEWLRTRGGQIVGFGLLAATSLTAASTQIAGNLSRPAPDGGERIGG